MSAPALKRTAFIAVFALILLSQFSAVTRAADAPPLKPSIGEADFIGQVTKGLQTKYPTQQSAIAAGYYQMTRVGKDGTSIWTNNKWDGIAKYEPNFLWYDKHGKLVGLDYQYPVSAWPKPPGASVYPVAASRWTTIDPHMHIGYKMPDGTTKRHGAEMLASAHGAKPTSAQLRTAKLLPKGATLMWVEMHPKAWDLGFWLVPNPNGAFADLNPLVKP